MDTGGGGGTSTGGVFSLSGTIGQHDAGTMSGGNYSFTGGFSSLYAIQTPGPPLLTVSAAGTVAYYPTNYPSSALSTKRVGNVTMTVTGDTNLSVVTLADGSYGLSEYSDRRDLLCHAEQDR